MANQATTTYKVTGSRKAVGDIWTCCHSWGDVFVW